MYYTFSRAIYVVLWLAEDFDDAAFCWDRIVAVLINHF
jgi:hypothetical protein